VPDKYVFDSGIYKNYSPLGRSALHGSDLRRGHDLLPKKQLRPGLHRKLVIQNLLRAQLLFVWVRAFTLTQFGGINFLGIQVPFWGPLPMGFMLFTEFFLVLMCMIFIITFCHQAHLEQRALATTGDTEYCHSDCHYNAGQRQ
jgi:hypothetical protein